MGLDTDIRKLPQHLSPTPESVLTFNKAIVEATREFAVSYKINTAFYESMGIAGWELMQETLKLLPEDTFRIADAKRGDIGNTSTMYARAFFEEMNFDSITVSPYMGSDSVQPFMAFPDKWTILLALTSNAGGADFQMLKSNGEELYKQVLRVSSSWGSPENTMYVVGATRAEYLQEVRRIVPDHFLLVPGVGAQGGSLSEVVKYGANADIGLLINASRSILYASSGEDFAEKAHQEAQKLQREMESYL